MLSISNGCSSGRGHIEVQLLGDAHGTVVPFVERECSIQRRHQKLVEESPSPSVSDALRTELMESAAAIGRAVGYTSAGTVEFLLDAEGKFYFLEMNTRLQVEHPVTEAVTGLDFVRAQIEIAQGKRFREPFSDAPGEKGSRNLSRGHAIECRIYAEDPDLGFLPSPGLITHLRAPSGPGIRDDSGAFAGWTVPTSYDPLISKVIAWAPDRAGAIARMVRALTEYELRGIRTTIGFCRWLLSTPGFEAGDFDTTTVDRVVDDYRKSAAQSGCGARRDGGGGGRVVRAGGGHAPASPRDAAPQWPTASGRSKRGWRVFADRLRAQDSGLRAQGKPLPAPRAVSREP
jgi:acetyl-CoA carboxylase biotin carboxylase subunit